MNNIYLPKKHKIVKISKIQDIEWLFEVEFEEMASPGQFIQISLPLVGEAPISITKVDQKNKTIEFLIRKVGKVTSKLFELEVGDFFYLRGPFGSTFKLDEYVGKDILVISGGSGIAPVRPIINRFSKEANYHQISGFRDNKGILFKDEINNWIKENKNIIVTLDKNVEEDPKYKEGLVTLYIEEVLKKMDLKNMVCIVVGPPVMMHFACLKLTEQGVKDEQIVVSFERNMSCAVGKCGHCKIDETYICLEGPVFSYVKAKTLLD